MSIPTNSPDTFGTATYSPDTAADHTMTIVDALDMAPSPKTTGHLPAVQRILQGDGANLILFSFSPGQYLAEHKAAHPITVQCIAGTLTFGCNDQTIELTPGRIIHLNAHVIHRVDCPSDSSAEENILLLTMLTGERQ
ncbi:cupin domain-containing protein [Corynebacterium mustelae]|uniref:Cupin domain-containing protein n=1 Tax=Corynebacterium mustelae TaxID=571915 RepID=A0A0G3H580_9CORY|nr:cupin domain-containing protein [Corynebacterium mustelae]AKK06257.1 cupin domain-containing protein [Corynebacterium mustelae]